MPHEFGPGFPGGIERGVDGFHWFGIVPALLLLVLIGVIVWAVLRLTRDGHVLAATGRAAVPAGAAVGPRADAALDELRLRYARGEMTREDYAGRWADLTGATPARPEADPPPPDGA
jgi:putative membrane protein